MNYSVAVKTAAAAEPITLDEAKLHLRVDIDDEDLLIEGLIAAAREWCENYTRRSFVQRTLELRLDCFPAAIKLPRGPIISVTTVKYLDQGGTLQTVSASDYQTDLYSVPGRVMPIFGGVWPTPKYGSLNAVVVEYEAGYAHGAGSPTELAENVPSAVKSAMKLMIGHWFQNRESVAMNVAPPTEVPLAVKQLLAPLEIRDFCLE